MKESKNDAINQSMRYAKIRQRKYTIDQRHFSTYLQITFQPHPCFYYCGFYLIMQKMLPFKFLKIITIAEKLSSKFVFLSTWEWTLKYPILKFHSHFLIFSSNSAYSEIPISIFSFIKIFLATRDLQVAKGFLTTRKRIFNHPA